MSAREEWLRELDALAGEHVMGWRIAGRACAVFVEGDWSVHPDSEPEGWACYAGMEPVYQRHESEHRPEPPEPDAEGWEHRMYKRHLVDWEADMEAFGCSRWCLDVVPIFTRSISDAWRLVEAIREIHWDVCIMADQYGPSRRVWRCCADEDEWEEGAWNVHAEADTAPLAIVLAALKAVGCEIPEEPTRE